MEIHVDLALGTAAATGAAVGFALGGFVGWLSNAGRQARLVAAAESRFAKLLSMYASRKPKSAAQLDEDAMKTSTYRRPPLAVPVPPPANEAPTAVYTFDREDGAAGAKR